MRMVLDSKRSECPISGLIIYGPIFNPTLSVLDRLIDFPDSDIVHFPVFKIRKSCSILGCHVAYSDASAFNTHFKVYIND